MNNAGEQPLYTRHSATSNQIDCVINPLPPNIRDFYDVRDCNHMPKRSFVHNRTYELFGIAINHINGLKQEMRNSTEVRSLLH